jgi:hypothetical protein
VVVESSGGTIFNAVSGSTIASIAILCLGAVHV